MKHGICTRIVEEPINYVDPSGHFVVAIPLVEYYFISAVVSIVVTKEAIDVVSAKRHKQKNTIQIHMVEKIKRSKGEKIKIRIEQKKTTNLKTIRGIICQLNQKNIHQIEDHNKYKGENNMNIWNCDNWKKVYKGNNIRNGLD